MSYHRKSADLFGRQGGGQRALCTQGYLAAGADIAEMGVSPYQIAGDPVVALHAQLNRFAGKTVNPGGKCGSRTYLRSDLPLAKTIDDQVATIALLILRDRYECVPIDVWSQQKSKWVTEGLGNAVPFVTGNLAEITVTIAQIGDSLDLAPAKQGITRRDPKFTPKFPVVTVAIIGALALAAVAISRRK